MDPQSHLNLTQQVAETLGLAIVKGIYDIHNPVPSEAVISKELGVSRSATREAVKALTAKGLISSRARQGIRILPEQQWNLFDTDVLRWIRDANPSLELLREFAELRLAIEPEAARLAAKRGTTQQKAKIGAALERMRLAESGLEDPLQADINFHLCILEASGNRFFMQLGRIIDTTLRVSIRFTNRRRGVQAASYLDHKKVFDGIAASDPESATQAASELMLEALEHIRSALRERDAPTD